MKDIKYIIADNVRLYRKKKNLTQAELAERAELSLDSIKRVEQGREPCLWKISSACQMRCEFP